MPSHPTAHAHQKVIPFPFVRHKRTALFTTTRVCQHLAMELRFSQQTTAFAIEQIAHRRGEHTAFHFIRGYGVFKSHQAQLFGAFLFGHDRKPFHGKGAIALRSETIEPLRQQAPFYRVGVWC